MSLGSFVQGAFQGYQFGENVKDRKTERKRDEERFDWERDDQEWRGETRDRQRTDWDYTDEQRTRTRQGWQREDKERNRQEATRDELDRIREEGFEEWENGQGGQSVPQNTPQGTVFTPLDPSAGTGQQTPNPAQATFPGMNVPGLSDRNPNATPFRYGDDVPRMEGRPIRVPLGRANDEIVLTDIEPVKGTYSEEERRQIEREARTMGMTPDEYVRSVTGTSRPANVDQTDDARARRGTGRTGDISTQKPEKERQATQEEGRETGTTALTPNANARQAIDYPYNPSSPEMRDGRMNPGGARGRPALADMMDAAPQDTAETTGTPEAAPGASVRRENRSAGPEAAPIEDAGPEFTDERLNRRPAYAETRQEGAPVPQVEPQPSTGSRARAGLDSPAAPQPAQQPGQGAASAAQPPQQAAPAQAPAPTQTPAPQGSGAGQPVYGGMTASQAAQFQDLPEPRMALEDGGQPISVARDSLASNANADNKGQAPQVSDQQRAQGASTFREYYQAEVVPRQVEALYRAGEIEKAEQLQTWLEDERSQSLQENYARAVHAASIGDERGFFDHLGKVYNGFDDGYRFIAEESDLYKNDAGETIAKVTLEDTETGERFTQEYEGGEELIQQVLTQMDPISVFEQLRGQAEAEAAAAAEQQAWEVGESRRRIEEGYETPADRRKVFTEAYKMLSETNPGWLSMSPEEKDIAIADFLATQQAFMSRGTTSPNAPVYLGQ